MKPENTSADQGEKSKFAEMTSAASNYIANSVDQHYLPWQESTAFLARKNALHLRFTWHVLKHDAVIESMHLSRARQDSDEHQTWKQQYLGHTYKSIAHKLKITDPLNEESHKQLEKALAKDWRERADKEPPKPEETHYTENTISALTTVFNTTLWIGKNIGHGLSVGAHYASDHYHFPWQNQTSFLERRSKVQLIFGWNPLRGIYVMSATIKDENAELNENSKKQLKTWYPEFHPGNKYELVTGDLHRRHIKAKELIKIELQNQFTEIKLAELQQLCEIKDAPPLTQEQHEKLEKHILTLWQTKMSDPANIYIGPSFPNTALGRLLKTLIPKVQDGEAKFTPISLNLKSYGLADDTTIEVSTWEMLLNLCFNSCYDFVYPEGEEFVTKTDADNAAHHLQANTLRLYAMDRLTERLKKKPAKEERAILEERLKDYQTEDAIQKQKPTDLMPPTLSKRSFYWQTALQTSKKEFMKTQIAAAQADFKRIFKIS